jgi:Fe-S-cluster-containing dehydrogenase component/anaerobic selenocysteine-containing dehydrogenase
MSRRKEYEFAAPIDGGQLFWRSLEAKQNPQLATQGAKAEFADGLADFDVSSKRHQLPEVAAEATPGGVGRRNFMMFTGAAATLYGCARRPVEKILPYARQPEYAIPGISSFYATGIAYRGDVVGIVVESHEGRPTKIEGNVDHPRSVGATDALTQAGIWDLYDPDRLRKPLFNGKEVKSAEVDTALADLAKDATENGGKTLRILSAASISPSFIRLREAVKARLPGVKFHTYSSVNEASVRLGAQLAFGRAVATVPDYARAKVILTLDADILGGESGSIKAARGYADGRRLRTTSDPMNRLYVVEPSLSVTGANADHRLRLPASQVESYLTALGSELAKKHGVDLGPLGQLTADVKGVPEKWLVEVAKELANNKGKAIVVAGSGQPARVHAYVHAINAALGNGGQTLQHHPAVDAAVDELKDLKELCSAMADGKVETLIILGGNPQYDAPADVKFEAALAKVKTRVHVSSHANETSALCTQVVPRAHDLEAWGDLRAIDGTYTLQQPLIMPLHGGKSDLEVLGQLAKVPDLKGLSIVQDTFKTSNGLVGPEANAWALALKNGMHRSSHQVTGAGGATAANPTLALGALPTNFADIAAEYTKSKRVAPPSADALEVTFSADPCLFDGSRANNSMLLELPHPISKITWDNAAYVSPATATALNLETGDLVRLSRDGATSVEVAVYILPGQADNVISLQLGWGRLDAGRYGKKHGFDIQGLRTTDAFHFASGVKLAKVPLGEISGLASKYANLGKAGSEGPVPGRVGPVGPFDVNTSRYRFVRTQEHGSMEGRAIALDATLAQYKETPNFPQFKSPDPKVLPLWKKRDYNKGEQNPTGYKWGMVFDLNSCTGCNACIVACQSENNIPNVGKEQIERGREMYWIRLDRYFVGLDENDPKIAFQPVACVQCEEAPCENVCPVNATEHSPEGLNDMAYNRCIGTRYCANNCPYKVRRFNYLNWHGTSDDNSLPDTEKMRMNPNVTIRMRGVMEKCNYCVQRIQEGKYAVKREGRTIRDGDVKTACQSACPADAIVFGDLNDPSSKVAKLRDLDRSYRLLAELGTGPRTTYLGKIRNPNPAMGVDKG